MAPRWDRDELLARVDLRALMDDLAGPATGQGANARWHCIVHEHDDSHPSVSVSVDRHGVERWRCWSGGHGGTAIDAICTSNLVGVAEAISILAERSRFRPDSPLPEGVVRPERPIRLPVSLDPCVVRYVEICEGMLWRPIGRPVLDHLVEERGLDPDVLRMNRVGADPGPVMRRPSGLPRGGVGAVFPVLDVGGSISYCQTRYLHPAPDRSKYDNPAGGLGDNPPHGWTRPVGFERDPVVLCEGLPDAYTVSAAGYTAVAVLGALNATPELVSRIAPRLADRPVIVAFDADDAGRTASRLLHQELTRRGATAVELNLLPGLDVNGWVRAARPDPALERPGVLSRVQPSRTGTGGRLMEREL